MKYKSKPHTVEAILVDNNLNNDQLHELIQDGSITSINLHINEYGYPTIDLSTHRGNFIARMYDWIVKDSNGNVSVLSSEDFKKFYEKESI